MDFSYELINHNVFFITKSSNWSTWTICAYWCFGSRWTCCWLRFPIVATKVVVATWYLRMIGGLTNLWLLKTEPLV